MIKRLAVLALLPLAVPGCVGQGQFGLLNGALTGALSGIAPTITVEQILQQYAIYHNLKVGLEQIEASGMVTMTTQTPIVITGTPMTPPMVPPITITPLPPPTMPKPTTTPSSGPIVTPTP